MSSTLFVTGLLPKGREASFGVELSVDFEPKAAEFSDDFEPKAVELSVDLPKAELLEACPLTKELGAEVPNIPELGLLSMLAILDEPNENPVVSFLGLSSDDLAPNENTGLSDLSEDKPMENADFSVEPVENAAFSVDPIENVDFSVGPLEKAGSATAVGFGLELLPKENGVLVNFSVGALVEPKANPAEAGLSSFGGGVALLLAPKTKLDLASGSVVLLGGAPKAKPLPEEAEDAPNANPPPGLLSVSAAPNVNPPVSPNAGLVPLLSVGLFSDTEKGAIFG